MIAALLLVALTLGPDDPLPPLNKAVLADARSALGKKVGGGQCTELAVRALRIAEARADFFGSGGGENTWGRKVATLTAEDHPVADILPGDIVQMADVHLESVTPYRRGGVTGTRRLWSDYPHHTAVVSAVGDGAIKVLQQNVGAGVTPKGGANKPRKGEDPNVVREDTLRLDDLRRGTIWVYRPVPARAAAEPR